MNWLSKLLGTPQPSIAVDDKVQPPHTLEKSIRAHLAPLLREDGFTGSGRTFRRFGDGIAHVVRVQGSSYGGKFAVNLGVHPLSVPLDACPNLRKMTEADCVLRRRLSLDGGDQWWPHDSSQASMDAAVADAAAVYAVRGRQMFAPFIGPATPLHTMTAANLAEGAYDLHGFWVLGTGLARTLAQMRQAEGDLAAARAFAQLAVDRMGDGSLDSGTPPELRAILEA